LVTLVVSRFDWLYGVTYLLLYIFREWLFWTVSVAMLITP
jgi:hypothetical protein